MKNVFVSIVFIAFFAGPQLAQALIGGRLANQGEFPSVVWLLGVNCTATKIGPKHLLLAAHCIDRDGYGKAVLKGDPVDIYIGVEPARMRHERLVAEEIFVHPSWTAHVNKTHALEKTLGKPGVIDLAVIVTNKIIRNVPDERLEFSPVRPGVAVVIGGYGCDAFGSRPSDTYKVALKRIYQVKPSVFGVGPEDASGNSYSMGCEGDSGGPVHVLSARAAPRIVGVNSFVRGAFDVNPDGSLRSRRSGPGTTFFTRLDLPAVQSWLQGVLRKRSPI